MDFLNIDNKKMSKSLGNFFTVREIGEKYDLQVLRFFMLSAHYRSPLNFSADLMEASKNGLERILTCMEKLKGWKRRQRARRSPAASRRIWLRRISSGQSLRPLWRMISTRQTRFPRSLSWVKLANSTADSSSTGKYVSSLRETIGQLCDVLGIITERKAEILDSEIEAMIEERQQARKAKNFALADEIRGRLLIWELRWRTRERA